MTVRNDDWDTPWRRVAASLYKRPKEGKVTGSVSLDVTAAEDWISRRRAQGLKVTMTHILLLAIARGIHEKVPAFNGYVRRGRVVGRPVLDASLSILDPLSGEMSAVRIANVGHRTLAELIPQLDQEIRQVKSGAVLPDMRIKTRLAKIPWPLRSWVVRLVAFLTLDLGIYWPKLGLRNDRFGCFLLTNIGTLGLDVGYPALFPNANVSLVVTMGAPKTVPEFKDGEWVPRRMITLGASVDHRIVDGSHIGKLFTQVRKMVSDPSILEQPGQDPA